MSIYFLETSEEKAPVWYVECALRSYGVMGILDKINGLIWSKPYDEKYYNEYNNTIVKVMKEFGKEELPIIFNMNFRHTEPKICLPYGINAEINCDKKTFSIIESAVVG